MENSNELYFYRSKGKLFWLVLICAAAALFFGVVTYYGFEGFSYYMGIAFTLFMAIISLIILKRMLTTHPYLLLTEEALWINVSDRNEIIVPWEDIRGYRLETLNHNKILKVILYDEEKGLSNQSGILKIIKKGMRVNPYTIVWGQIKRRDRKCLALALERNVPGSEGDLYAVTHKSPLKERIQKKLLVLLYLATLLVMEIGALFLSQKVAPDSMLLLLVFLVLMAIVHFFLFAYIGLNIEGFRDRHFNREYNNILKTYHKTGDASLFLDDLKSMDYSPKTTQGVSVYYLSLSTALHRNHQDEEALACLDNITTSDEKFQKTVAQQRKLIEDESPLLHKP
ncbi:hypothetical protein KFZ56_17335 [Virgibacillus sp. NKC19-3]|uniref:STM3941 family protein n=1 Tax=Virgibacillus saliphilus TaxID=2831674 RepID=UPI001C9A2FB6|nr:STM3941 family protein [Virgibacillus sp. NKC19-3]MBY7144785.1 hypothetical protein [Virgibacillus sp. NKC19-3]